MKIYIILFLFLLPIACNNSNEINPIQKIIGSNDDTVLIQELNKLNRENGTNYTLNDLKAIKNKPYDETGHITLGVKFPDKILNTSLNVSQKDLVSTYHLNQNRYYYPDEIEVIEKSLPTPCPTNIFIWDCEVNENNYIDNNIGCKDKNGVINADCVIKNSKKHPIPSCYFQFIPQSVAHEKDIFTKNPELYNAIINKYREHPIYTTPTPTYSETPLPLPSCSYVPNPTRQIWNIDHNLETTATPQIEISSNCNKDNCTILLK